MRKLLLFIFILILPFILKAQKDTTNVIGILPQKFNSHEASNINISIFPVPVRDNSFTIRTDRDMSLIRITNIIGQDIYKIQYSNSQQLVRIPLDNPKRGFYLVTILFSDGTRVVKKIMIEQPE
jgi:hypothetical protein